MNSGSVIGSADSTRTLRGEDQPVFDELMGKVSRLYDLLSEIGGSLERIEKRLGVSITPPPAPEVAERADAPVSGAVGELRSRLDVALRSAGFSAGTVARLADRL